MIRRTYNFVDFILLKRNIVIQKAQFKELIFRTSL